MPPIIFRRPIDFNGDNIIAIASYTKTFLFDKTKMLVKAYSESKVSGNAIKLVLEKSFSNSYEFDQLYTEKITS